MPLDGLRILSLESRKAHDMQALILREGGLPVLAPSVKERAIEGDDTALRFIQDLEARRFEVVVFMTGVGLAFMRDTLLPHMPAERIGAALRSSRIVSRGPKPVGILRELGVKVDVMIPEPNTWREIVQAIHLRPERRIAVQEYGRPNEELTKALTALGAEVTNIALYKWDLPDDLRPLEEAVRKLASGGIDLVLFTSSIQYDHLMEVAQRLGIADRVWNALQQHVAVASVGPVMTEWLTARGIEPDIVPRHPKMWALVKAASEEALGTIARKRARCDTRHHAQGIQGDAGLFAQFGNGSE